MPDEPTSMQDQSPLSEAQDSVHKARRAALQALSHTSNQMLEQASHAISKARNALTQIDDEDNPVACNEVRQELSSVEGDYQSALRNQKQDANL